MYNFMFTGGGSRGFCYVGVLEALDKIKPEINIHSGSSIGAVMLTMYALGYSSNEIKTEFEKINFLYLFSDFNFSVITDLCISKGEKYLKKLRELIEMKYYDENYKKGKMKPVCFKDVDKEIYITATNLLKGEVQVFSKHTTPDVEIAQALRASSSMPFLMKPFKINNETFIDGDISRAIPIISNIPELLSNKFIEIRITGKKETNETKNPVKFVNNVVGICANAMDENAIRENEKIYDIIKIETENIGYTDFFISKQKKQELYKLGYEEVIKYLKKYYP